MTTTGDRRKLLWISFYAFVLIGLPNGALNMAWRHMQDTFGLGLDALGAVLGAITVGRLLLSFYSGRIIAIDPKFSVYNLVERTHANSAVLRHRATMMQISYEIATRVEKAHNRIFAGFQYLSRFLPQVERYRQMAVNAESVYVFGIPDVTPPNIPNIIYISVTEQDALAKEWFLVSYGVDYASALATEEITTTDQQPLGSGAFKGFLNFNPGLVSILNAWLSSAVGAHALLLEPEQVNLRRAHEIQRKSAAHFRARIAALSGDQKRQQLYAE